MTRKDCGNTLDQLHAMIVALEEDNYDGASDEAVQQANVAVTALARARWEVAKLAHRLQEVPE